MRIATNMSEGSIWKHLIRFAFPVMLGNLLQQCYNLVDTMIVGRTLGVSALAAVGATSNIMFFLFTFISGVAMGVSIIISQYYGAKDYRMLRRTFGASVLAMLGITLVVTLLGLLFRRPLLQLLNTPEDILEMSEGYLTIIIVGMCTTGLYNWISSILRAMGNSLTPLLFLAVSAVLNIFFNYFFILVLHMGVEGAAWGTVIAQLLSGGACLIYAMRVMPELRIDRHTIRWDWPIVRNILKYGVPAGLQTSFISISIMAMQSVVNTYGSVVTAAYSVATRMENFSMMAGNSIGMAMGTFVGQNIGAGKPDRVKKGFRVSVLLVLCICAVLSPVLFFFAEPITALFVDQPSAPESAQMIEIAARYMRTFTFFLFFVGVLNQLQNLLRSAGDVGMTMTMGGWEIITRVVVSFTLSSLLGMNGIWWATPITWTTTMLWGLARYFSGKWQNRAVNAGRLKEEKA